MKLRAHELSIHVLLARQPLRAQIFKRKIQIEVSSLHKPDKNDENEEKS